MTEADLRRRLREMGYDAHSIELRVLRARQWWMFQGCVVDGEPIDRMAQQREQTRLALISKDRSREP